ncbi:MAG: hypothetical protein AB1478_05015, partial [Nitrospirota bacterium]
GGWYYYYDRPTNWARYGDSSSRQKNGTRAPYRLVACKASKFLQVIRPYVRVKKPQLELALHFQELKSAGKRGRKTPEKDIELFDSIRQEMQRLNKQVSQDFHRKSGELLGHPERDNQQPSLPNVLSIVGRKVHRLTGEEAQANKPDTSARPEREDIVGATG